MYKFVTHTLDGFYLGRSTEVMHRILKKSTTGPSSRLGTSKIRSQYEFQSTIYFPQNGWITSHATCGELQMLQWVAICIDDAVEDGNNRSFRDSWFDFNIRTTLLVFDSMISQRACDQGLSVVQCAFSDDTKTPKYPHWIYSSSFQSSPLPADLAWI